MALQPKTDQPSPAKCGEVSIKIDANFDDSELSLQLKDGKYHCMIDGQLYPLATTLFERFPDKVRKLLKIGGSVMAMCYALHNLGLYAYNFMRGTLSFTIGFDDVDKMESVQLNIESGKFNETLLKEWKRIVDEHKKELGHLQKKYQGQIAIGDIKMIDNTQGPTTSNTVSATPGISVTSSGNVNIGQSGGISMQARDHGQMAKGDITNTNNPAGPTFNTKNKTSLSGNNTIVGSNVGVQNIRK